MRLFGLFPTTFASLLLLITIGDFANAAHRNSVLLKNIHTLTLRNDAKTSYRRVSAIPQVGEILMTTTSKFVANTCRQLKCVGGNAKGLYEVDVMRCTNSGSSYDENNAEWTCKASLPPEFKLGSTEVICEGYEYPEDPYVLKGSCGVEYRLILTELGEEKYGKKDTWSSNRDVGGSTWDDVYTVVFWILFLLILVWILVTFCNSNANNRPRQRRGGWFGGGWEGGDGNDPPPPYMPRSHRKTYYTNSGGEGWRPGFWSGVAGGTAAGYAAGRMAGGNQNNRTWFRGSNDDTTAGPSGSNSGRRSASSSTYSSSRYESTGFGSTSRR